MKTEQTGPMMTRQTRPASLALRVTAFVGIATILVFFAFGQIVVHSLEQHFAEIDAGELGIVAESVQNVLQQPASGSTLEARLAGAVVGHHGMYFQVLAASGARLYSSPGMDLSEPAGQLKPVAHIAANTLDVWEQGGKRYRGAVLRIATGAATGAADVTPQHYTVVVATAIDMHLHYIDNFQQTLWLTTAVVCAIALLAAWLAVWQGHAPIRHISARMRGITSTQLHIRLVPEEVPIELAGLVASFNDMLGRLEIGFRQLSDFSADIAHELRTPITNLTTETQVALSQKRGADQYREILYSNLEEFERMGKMIADMLFLAQTENDLASLTLRNIDLGAQISALFDYFEAWAEDRGVSFKLEGTAHMVAGDPLMLRRALGNLLSNAIRYTPRAGVVTATLSSKEGRTVVRIENPGDTIAEEHLSRLFDRFYRVDPSRQRQRDVAGNEGAGLGLAIVKSIIEAHQGTVRASSHSSVITFEIILPSVE
jgi:two-component system heavy metal sensor histidine kinase CusS